MRWVYEIKMPFLWYEIQFGPINAEKFFVEQCNNGNRAMQNSNAIFKIEQFILMDWMLGNEIFWIRKFEKTVK